ncbi:unnamed protein product [Protopolystoma xenopodis]|uniref:Uncharacterized protein n=1 Tax=Protopolystoma xenopodis TaxID=117903 RepID=A0A3S5ANE7_9PLAT|nr:unnamed protein product [Protopolystoma xenopodis]
MCVCLTLLSSASPLNLSPDGGDVCLGHLRPSSSALSPYSGMVTSGFPSSSSPQLASTLPSPHPPSSCMASLQQSMST